MIPILNLMHLIQLCVYYFLVLFYLFQKVNLTVLHLTQRYKLSITLPCIRMIFSKSRRQTLILRQQTQWVVMMLLLLLGLLYYLIGLLGVVKASVAAHWYRASIMILKTSNCLVMVWHWTE